MPRRGDTGACPAPGSAGDARPYELTTAYDRSRDATVVRLTGEIDCAAADAAQAWLIDDAAVRDGATLVVDVRRVRFLDVAGLNLILALRRMAERRSLGFRLEGLHGQPQRLVDIAAAAGTIPALG